MVTEYRFSNLYSVIYCVFGNYVTSKYITESSSDLIIIKRRPARQPMPNMQLPREDVTEFSGCPVAGRSFTQPCVWSKFILIRILQICDAVTKSNAYLSENCNSVTFAATRVYICEI